MDVMKWSLEEILCNFGWEDTYLYGEGGKKNKCIKRETSLLPVF